MLSLSLYDMMTLSYAIIFREIVLIWGIYHTNRLLIVVPKSYLDTVFAESRIILQKQDQTTALLLFCLRFGVQLASLEETGSPWTLSRKEYYASLGTNTFVLAR